MIIPVYLFLVFSSLCLGNEDAPRVKTPLGSIKGYHKISEHGRIYEAYEGIPYALPPIGKLRFKAPEAVKAWQGELQATKKSHECLQYSHKPGWLKKVERVEGAEDCLYMNIYVPDRDSATSLLPVFFWIHGGAFVHGSGNAFGAKYLVDKDIIVVAINYRLGPLGFLSTEDDVVPGNMGLKDQSMALGWVHENIEYFGGDPKRISLMSCSAGGVSVHYHYFSPLSAGLFQNGISFSGTVLDCWAQTEGSLEKAKKLGALMGCPSESSNKEMVECLRHRPARAMVQAVQEFMPWLYNPYTPFGPVVEKAGDKPFVNRPPVEMLATGELADVPWITSITSEEGLYPVAEFAANDLLLRELDENWSTLAAHLLDFNYTIPPDEQTELAMRIRRHYMGNNPINRENLRPITKMVGDRLFVVGAEKAARMQARANKSPVWFYYYGYRAAGSLSNALSGTKEDFGVSHADDTFLILENQFFDPTTTESDRKMQSHLLNMASTFIEKTAEVYPSEWRKVDPLEKDFHYLEISGPTKYKMASQSNLGDKHFWASINFDENVLKSTNTKDEL